MSESRLTTADSQLIGMRYPAFGRFGLRRMGFRALPPLAISLVSYITSPNDISSLQWMFAFILLQIPVSAYLNWRQRQDSKIPTFALIAFIYWVYYAVSLFWGARTPSGIDSTYEKTVSDESITWALIIAVMGVSSVWLGMRVGLDKRLMSIRLPELRKSGGTLHYLRLLLILSTFLSFFEKLPFAAGEGSRQVLTIIVTIVPLVAFAILFRRVLVGEAGQLDRILVVGFLGLRLVTGLSSGWLGAFAAILVVCAAVYLSERRRMPRVALVLVVLFTLFFQVGKQEFRSVYWKGNAETGKIDRVRFWAEISLTKWEEALNDRSGGALADAINVSLSRVSLLTQTANVLDLTPESVPYQYGQLYYYLLITWIPRAVWPEKPSMSEANQFYQVAYGLSREEDLDNVAIGVGVLTEGYISFGLYGVVGIMFLLGIFYSVFQRFFFSLTSGVLMTGIGIALLPQLIGIETQMAGYLGGIVQQIGMTLVLFLPVISLKRQQRVQHFKPVSLRVPVNTGSFNR